MKYCSHCGAEVPEEATFCPKCGGSLAADPLVENNVAVSDKDWLATFLLCWFLGVFGAHRFYVGKTGFYVIVKWVGHVGRCPQNGASADDLLQSSKEYSKKKYAQLLIACA